MNLRDKLNAISAQPKPKVKAEPPREYSCYHVAHTHSLDEFPMADEITREAIMLMQGEEMPQDFDPYRILYLDTETTGFQGAGTVVFMIGVGWLTEYGFEVHQYVMRDYPQERAQLTELQKILCRFNVICTFNGRTFDIPMLRTRFLMNRMKPDCLELPHIDLLHIARRVWKLRLNRCNLGRLQEAILGHPRTDDLPGSEAPKRFFAMVQTGQLHLIDEVLQHNEQDVASMCTLLAHMHHMYCAPETVKHAEDVYSMGVALEKLHHPEEARRCYRLISAGHMHAGSQLRLASSYRRSGDRESARAVWQSMIDRGEGGARPYIELAKYYEHTARDPQQALRCTRLAMAALAQPSLLDPPDSVQLRQELLHRYQRLSRITRGDHKQ